jgi:integrase/recombinase XerD
MHKTKDELELPLNKKAIQLIPPKTFDEDRLFPVYTNQPMNRYLQKAADLAQIPKNISFHCSRHTFATMLLSKGADITTVSKLLGHQSLKTTMIYAKILPQTKRKAVDLLDM